MTTCNLNQATSTSNLKVSSRGELEAHDSHLAGLESIVHPHDKRVMCHRQYPPKKTIGNVRERRRWGRGKRVVPEVES